MIKDITDYLTDDLASFNSFIKSHPKKIKGYMLVAVTDNETYTYSWNYTETPMLLLAITELLLFDVKTLIKQGLDDYKNVKLDNIKYRSSLQ